MDATAARIKRCVCAFKCSPLAQLTILTSLLVTQLSPPSGKLGSAQWLLLKLASSGCACAATCSPTAGLAMILHSEAYHAKPLLRPARQLSHHERQK